MRATHAEFQTGEALSALPFFFPWFYFRESGGTDRHFSDGGFVRL